MWMHSARSIWKNWRRLLAKGCADPYGTNGHDPEAEQLKQDIDKMLEELDAEPEPPQDQSEDKEGGGGSDSEDKQKSQREKQLEKELEEQKQENMEERQETQDAAHQKQDSQAGGEGGSNFDGKTW